MAARFASHAAALADDNCGGDKCGNAHVPGTLGSFCLGKFEDQMEPVLHGMVWCVKKERKIFWVHPNPTVNPFVRY